MTPPKLPRLVRNFKGSRYLKFEPERHCECGGMLAVQDHRTAGGPPTAKKETRYECYCEECKNCDPNGHATQLQVLENSPAYFNSPPPAPC